MAPPLFKIIAHLQSQGIELAELSRKDRWELQRRWRDTFAGRSPERFRSRRMRADWEWLGIEGTRCLRDAKALYAYQDSAIPEFCIVLEGNAGAAFACRGERMPEFAGIGTDIYVFPNDLRWTMVFTHDGPIFARAEWHASDADHFDRPSNHSAP